MNKSVITYHRKVGCENGAYNNDPHARFAIPIRNYSTVAPKTTLTYSIIHISMY